MANPTIAAITTPPGRGGVGIVRISGSQVAVIAEKILGLLPSPRYAYYSAFYNSAGEVIDRGIALYFPNPHSFTGEDVLELQGHGGPIILDMLLQAVLTAGAVLAKPGEFSERAFLNDKMDLTQAEAIADLIDASSVAAAKQAVNSLQGVFSQHIQLLVESLIHLRIYVEAAIDFPEEEVDFLTDGKIAEDLRQIISRVDQLFNTARQGVVLREGMKVVIAGRPNAGKSSLLNSLAEKDVAIVTAIAGTTRDVLKEHIQIDGMPLHIIDTAGLRDTVDEVEKIGISRAWNEIHSADRILLIVDTTDTSSHNLHSQWPEFFQPPMLAKLTLVANKIDQESQYPAVFDEQIPTVKISAKTGQGLTDLKNHLKEVMGLNTTLEGTFSARRRHLEALERARDALLHGQSQLLEYAAGELLADDLKRAQDHLNEITGAFTADDLLGRIFAGFCIGK
jgi:tRNA modification GTPase